MISRAVAKSMMDDAKAALEAVAAKYNTKIGFVSGSYEGTGLSIKIPFHLTDENGEAQTREFKLMKLRYPHLVGKTFDVVLTGKIQRMKFVGYNDRAPTYPIEVMQNGKRMRYPDSIVSIVTTRGTEVVA